MNITKRKSFRLTVLFCICILLVAVGIAAAQDDDLTPISEYQEIISEWQGSPHGNTYAPGKGPNTYCSRCHSPQNWDPESRPGTPPNCITCHFAHEEEMRVAETMDFVEEADWVGINCDTCHVVEGDMIDATGIAWYAPIAGEYVSVATPNELCEQCHTNSTGVSETGGRGVDHEIVLSGSAHNNWAATLGDRRPEYCSDCHNPHTQEPMGCMDCHEGMADLETHAGGGELNAQHLAAVDCIGCHDASGSEVGPNPDVEDYSFFTTIETGMSRGGEMTVSTIISHSVQWTVSCDRCHFADNEWELSVLTETGEAVEADS